MPKLSQQTLEKRFKCPHCGERIRSRQGLSGHIQFKHPKGATVAAAKSLEDLATEKIAMQRVASMGGVTDAELQELLEIRADWLFIRPLIEKGNIKLNAIDYKTYLFIAAAIMFGNQRLMNKLTKELNSAIGQLLEISSKMGSKS